MRIDGRRYLLAAGLPRGLQDGVANAEVIVRFGFDAPGVLNVPLEFVGAEMPIERTRRREAVFPK